MSSEGKNDGKEVIDPNVIRMRVENVTDLKWDEVESEVKRIDGFPWQCRVYLHKGADINIEVECLKSEESELWECDADLYIKMDHSGSFRSHCTKYEAAFKSCLTISDHHYTIGTLIDRESGNKVPFIADGCIVIEVNIVVKGGKGDRFRTKPPKPDFFSPSKFSDVILSAEGKKLHVSKQILAHASPYFESLFFGHFKEAQKNEIVLGEVSAEELVATLEWIYDTGKIDVDNVEFLLKMADRFDIPKIMIAAEEWLVKCCTERDIPKDVQLLLSDQFNLFTLQEMCLKDIKKWNVKNSESFKHFSSGLQDEITKRLTNKDVYAMPCDRVNDGGNAAKDRNVMRFRVANAWNLSNRPVTSKVKRIDGFPWQFEVFRDEWPDSLSVRIECNKSEECHLWWCVVEGRVKLINPKNDAASICQSFREFLCKDVSLIEHCNVFIGEWKESISDKNFVVNGGIEIEVMIKVKSRNGDRFRMKPRIHSLLSPSSFSDISFLIEGKRIYASKQILAYASPYFEKLFYGDLEQSQEKEIVLGDVSYKEFSVSLEMIYDTRRELDDDNVEFLVRMADRFEITGLLNRAEMRLTSGGGSRIAMHSKLRLADKHGLEVLKMDCVREISSSYSMGSVINSDSYKHYSRELVDKLMLKLLKLSDHRHGYNY